MKHFFLVCAVLVGILFSLDTYAQVGESIKSFDTTIEVQSDATIRVSERIQYNFGPNEKHGIYRDIPLSYNNKDLSLSSIIVTDQNGDLYNSVFSRNGDVGRIKIGDANTTVTGERVYVVSYTVSGAIGYFDSYDEVYWNATGNEWQVSIEKATVKIVLPSGITSTQSSCYWGEKGSNARCDKSKQEQGNETIFSTTQSVGNGLGMTVAVGFKKGVVAEPSFMQSVGYKVYSFLIKDGWVFYILLCVGCIYKFKKWYRFGRDPKGRGVIIPQYDVPDELSPMQVRFILKQDFGDSLSAEILYLATRGFITITRKPKEGIFGTEDYELRRIKVADSSLGEFQTLLLEGLFGKGVDVLESTTEKKIVPDSVIGGVLGDVLQVLSSLQIEKKNKKSKDVVSLVELRNTFYRTIPKIYGSVESSLVKEGYFENQVMFIRASSGGGSRVPGIVMFSGIALFMGSFFGGVFTSMFLHYQGTINFIISYTLFIILGAVFAILAPKMTPKGVETKEWIEGFKMYLSLAEKRRIEFHNAPKKDPKTFETFLPYAMALGVEKEWAKVFEGITMAPPSWYHDSSRASFNAAVFVGSMSSFSSMSHSALRSSPQSSGSRGGSSGGGSSGGGGGGGGGGSW